MCVRFILLFYFKYCAIICGHNFICLHILSQYWPFLHILSQLLSWKRDLCSEALKTAHKCMSYSRALNSVRRLWLWLYLAFVKWGCMSVKFVCLSGCPAFSSCEPHAFGCEGDMSRGSTCQGWEGVFEFELRTYEMCLFNLNKQKI